MKLLEFNAWNLLKFTDFCFVGVVLHYNMATVLLGLQSTLNELL